ncbi:methylated-DNA--[protein]-cysteine S-methyltransferase [Actinotalea sp. M2MS4P-6]|uniref:methylated-DNA--[protein]-cysteine S-methyltransferase n=1 Tax=Actinotalea sp. M2MS4P-6 TaxID=2983762 RepID=UPI0021E4FE13|nr:methylated-DNA--[protein]-cysteine S-methyltransferase [Actinotalea sp. M2MS4P-6]MCV2392716.1 methylated-DNA--[protein]-cysteine S-methyltransferase [Actinotalea sp. M2MS4P-6]
MRRVVASGVGPLLLEADGPRVRRITFLGPEQAEAARTAAASAPEESPLEEALLDETARQLAEYFAGEREEFALPLAPRGSEFQRSVWRALADVPYGTTITYGELAARVGASARAVGVALGQNPIVIVLPCHRVIGADGGLTGFGGGVERKETLLALEGSALL